MKRLSPRIATLLAVAATLAACQAKTPPAEAQAAATAAPAADAQVDTALSEIRARQFDPVTGKPRGATVVFAGPASQSAAVAGPSGNLGEANAMSGTLQGLTSDVAGDGPAH